MTSPMAVASPHLAERLPAGPAFNGADETDFYEQPVPRTFVHRAAVAEVLLTRFVPAVDDTYLIGAQWPRGHGFYRVRDGHYDPMLLAETIRQTGLMISHVGYNVPFGYSFVMRHISYRISPHALVSGVAPANVKLIVRCHDIKRKGNEVTGFAFDAEVHIRGERVGEGFGRLRCVDPVVFQRMCAMSRPSSGLIPWREPVRPAVVGREDINDVVLSPTSRPNSWLLRCDVTHPVLFDHPLDHIPGMALLEAARQAAHHLTHPSGVQVVGLTADFHRFVELDECALVQATAHEREADGTQLITVAVAADDRPLADMSLQLAHRSRRLTRRSR